jgi:hypothetical protein
MLVGANECVLYYSPRAVEERLLKVCASVSENKNCINRLARYWTGR